MGWAHCGTDINGRPIGYAHRAKCDWPGCENDIDRGLDYACGGMHGESEYACEKYFCHKHLVTAKLPNGDIEGFCPSCITSLEDSDALDLALLDDLFAADNDAPFDVAIGTLLPIVALARGVSLEEAECELRMSDRAMEVAPGVWQTQGKPFDESWASSTAAWKLLPWWQRLLARWRLWFGLCPYCNSDAPLLDDCPVCENYRGQYPPKASTKDLWQHRFAQQVAWENEQGKLNMNRSII